MNDIDVNAAFADGYMEVEPVPSDEWVQVLMDQHLPIVWLRKKGLDWVVCVSVEYLDQVSAGDARRQRKRFQRQIEMAQRTSSGVRFTMAGIGAYKVQVVGPFSRQQAREFSSTLLKLETAA